MSNVEEAVLLARRTVDETWPCTMCRGLLHPTGMTHSEAVKAGRVLSIDALALARALLALHDAAPATFSKVFVVHVYDAGDHMHDCYVHRTASFAVRQAAIDVVCGRYGAGDPCSFETELQRVIDAVYEEPGVGRRHVRCDSWRAHVDEMQVLT